MTTAPASERPSSDRPGQDLPGQDRHIYERQADHVRRDAIAAAAERAFVRHGFHTATMQQVAEVNALIAALASAGRKILVETNGAHPIDF